MIELQFDQETAAERQETLALHIDNRVTVHAVKGPQVEGVLVQLSARAATIKLDDGTSVTRPLGDLRTVWVHVGGDWITVRGHTAGAMTDRIHVRCTPDEKRKLAAYAQATNVSLSELVRQAALLILQNQAGKQSARKTPVRKGFS